MTNRLRTWSWLLAGAAVLSCVTGLPAQGRVAASHSTPGDWTPPRTSWGHPDLQGIWDTAVEIPLERSRELGAKAVLNAEELAARKLEAARRRKDLDDKHRAALAGEADVEKLTESQLAAIVAPAPEFSVRVAGNRPTYARTSLIVDPPDGRIPALTPQARTRLEQREAARYNRGEADSWVDRNNWERCITRTLPLAMLSTYASNYQILQTPEYFVIFVEMIHEPRIIPLDGRPRLPASLRQWLGDSRGHWEGDTLVVETTNFVNKLDGGLIMPSHPHIVFTHRGSGEHLRLVERFTRTDQHTIDYQFTVIDPTTYTKPWTASVPMRNDGTPKMVYEYACHEGNLAMVHLLKGARADEAAALEAARKESRERIAAGEPGVSLR